MTAPAADRPLAGQAPAHDSPRAAQSADAPHRPRFGLALVCAFALATSTNYTNHGPLFSLIAAEFGLRAGDVGLVASAWFSGSALTMLLGGVLADRVGPRQVVTLGFLLVVASNLGSGALAPTFPALLAWRALGGLGAGAAFAAGATYARALFAGRGTHLAQGLYGAAFLLGSGATLLTMPLLAGPEGDWRGAFVRSGVGVALCWLAWTTLAPTGTRARRQPGATLAAALRVRNTWILALCHMCGFGLAMVVSTWSTTFFARGFGLPLDQAGAVGSLLLATGIVARSVGGVVLERGVRPLVVIRGSLAVAVLGLALMALPAASLPLAALGMLVTGLGAGLPYAAVFNGAAASVPRSPASAQALVGWAAILITLVGPPLVGGLLDLTGSFTAGLLVLAGFTLLTLAVTAWLRPIAFGH